MTFASFLKWFERAPPKNSQADEQNQKIGDLLGEIRQESQQMSKSVELLQKADLLRSLVISMNRGDR